MKLSIFNHVIHNYIDDRLSNLFHVDILLLPKILIRQRILFPRYIVLNYFQKFRKSYDGFFSKNNFNFQRTRVGKIFSENQLSNIKISEDFGSTLFQKVLPDNTQST